MHVVNLSHPTECCLRQSFSFQRRWSEYNKLAQGAIVISREFDYTYVTSHVSWVGEMGGREIFVLEAVVELRGPTAAGNVWERHCCRLYWHGWYCLAIVVYGSNHDRSRGRRSRVTMNQPVSTDIMFATPYLGQLIAGIVRTTIVIRRETGLKHVLPVRGRLVRRLLLSFQRLRFTELRVSLAPSQSRAPRFPGRRHGRSLFRDVAQLHDDRLKTAVLVRLIDVHHLTTTRQCFAVSGLRSRFRLRHCSCLPARTPRRRFGRCLCLRRMSPLPIHGLLPLLAALLVAIATSQQTPVVEHVLKLGVDRPRTSLVPGSPRLLHEAVVQSEVVSDRAVPLLVAAVVREACLDVLYDLTQRAATLRRVGDGHADHGDVAASRNTQHKYVNMCKKIE